MQTKLVIRNLIAGVAIAAAGALAAGRLIPQQPAAAAAPATTTAAAAPGANVLLPDFTGIVDRNGPAVVNERSVLAVLPTLSLAQSKPGSDAWARVRIHRESGRGDPDQRARHR